MSKIAEECEDYRETLTLIVNDPDTSPQAKKYANYILTKWETYNNEGIETDENARS